MNDYNIQNLTGAGVNGAIGSIWEQCISANKFILADTGVDLNYFAPACATGADIYGAHYNGSGVFGYSPNGYYNNNNAATAYVAGADIRGACNGSVIGYSANGYYNDNNVSALGNYANVVSGTGLIYTQTANAEEKKGGWFETHIGADHILHTYTRQDFKDNGSVITVTAFDSYGPQATVQYNTFTDNLTHFCENHNCSAPLSGTLTCGAYTVNVCQHLSTADFGLLVRAVAFPNLFILFTNEVCLGYCSASLGSYSSSNNSIKKW